MLQTYRWVCFVLANSSWAGAWPSVWLIYPVVLHWDHRFYLSRLISIAASFLVRDGSCIHVALSVLGPRQAWTCAALCVPPRSLCQSCCVCTTVSLGSLTGAPPPHKSLVKTNSSASLPVPSGRHHSACHRYDNGPLLSVSFVVESCSGRLSAPGWLCLA